MDQADTSAQIFNHPLRTLRRKRAINRIESGKSEGFLLKHTAVFGAEKLLDVNRQFENAAIIGLPPFTQTLLENLPKNKLSQSIEQHDHWPEVFSETYDLIISGLVLQSRNDILLLMSQARAALRPDGLFLASLLGGQSLLGLRRACFAMDQEKFGGIIARIAPMIDLQQAGGLLSAAGLAQPVVDRDKINLSYKALRTMVNDLRDIGETNSLSTGSSVYSGKDFLARLENSYASKTKDGGFKGDFEVIWLTGWAPHESQQKPLKPGSANTSLASALRKIRD